MALIRLHDVLHDLVPDHVPPSEVDELDPLDAQEDLLHHAQAASLPGREVDLRDVAVDHGPRPEPDAREEHVHLLRRRVLRLVQDDERVVQRPAPEVRDGRHLDRSSFHQARERVRVGHLVQRVVQRLHVRIDLLVEGARQEPEALAGLDSGAGEDDAVHLFVLQGLHAEGNSQVRLARAGRADHEGDDVAADGVGIALLAAGLGTDGTTPGRAQDLGGEDLRGALVGLDHVDGASDVDAVEHMALLEEQHELVDERADPSRIRALDGDLVAADEGLGVEGRLDEPEELITLPEEPHHEVVLGLDLDLSLGHGVLIQRTRARCAERGVVSREASPGACRRARARGDGAPSSGRRRPR